VSAAVTVITKSEIVWLFLGAGVLVWLLRAPPKGWFGGRLNGIAASAPVAGVMLASTVDWNKLVEIGAFFAYAGSFVSGSGLAIVPFLYGGVVQEHHWLNDRQFVDAVAVAMVTPGPVVITTGFIGYLVAGAPGAIVAAIGTFLPPFLLTVIAAPYFRKYGKLPGLVAFVDGVTAAAIGAITGGAIVIARHSISDAASIAIAVVTVVLLWRFRKLQEPAVVAGAALVGL